jgi:hypothetical protein
MTRTGSPASSRKRAWLAAAAALLAVLALLALGAWRLGFFHVADMFRLNKACQEDGYYMAEFEFKMLGITYDLDKGRLLRASREINGLYAQMKTRSGLIKVPAFADKKQEMAFYLNLQNPRTGAFMDDAFPLCSYTGPTGNVLNLLAELSRETGQPLKLKYPLKYLDAIDTPERLRAYLDDVSTVGWLGAKFPQTSFHFARDLLSLFHEDGEVTRYGLYSVTPEWDAALMRWFYESQDPATGLWGPRSRAGRLRKKDTQNTASILKAFIDEEGRDINPEYPLRYRDALAGSMLASLSGKLPPDDAADEWHEWNLDRSKSIKLLTKLWPGLSAGRKEQVEALATRYVELKFEKFFVAGEGAFSHYPNAAHATLDGSSGIVGTFGDFGAYSRERYLRMWDGADGVAGIGPGRLAAREVTAAELAPILSTPGVTSIRAYGAEPAVGEYTAGVLGLFYPRKAVVRDAMELIPGMRAWLGASTQSMGNWTSREELARSLASIPIGPTRVFRGELPLDELNAALRGHGRLILIGFDALQLPRGELVLELAKAP